MSKENRQAEKEERRLAKICDRQERIAERQFEKELKKADRKEGKKLRGLWKEIWK